MKITEPHPDQAIPHPEATSIDREAINKQALFSAFENYVIARSGLVPLHATVAEWKTNSAYRTSTDPYDGQTAALNTINANNSLLESFTRHESAVETEPAITVCMPIAVNNEDPQKVSNVVKALARSQAKLKKPVDVVLWSNARYNDDNQAATEKAAQKNYEVLRAELAELNTDDFRLTSALQVLPEDQATMSKLRSNYMEAVALDAVEKGYGFDHPIMWVDADVTSLSSSSLEQIESSVRKFEAYFVHPNIHYSADWLKDKSFKGMDKATKAVVSGELQRRQHQRELIQGGFRNSDYIEESGLAFALGTYLEAGGVSTRVAVNESVGLQRNTVHTFFGYRHAHGKQAVNYDPQQTVDQGSIVPDALMPGGEYKFIPEDKQLPKVHMGLSARRHYEVVKKYGLPAVNNYNGVEASYTLFSDMEDASASTASFSDAELQALLEEIEQKHQEAPGYARQSATPSNKMRRQRLSKTIGASLSPNE